MSLGFFQSRGLGQSELIPVLMLDDAVLPVCRLLAVVRYGGIIG